MRTFKYTCLKEALSETEGKMIGISAQVQGINPQGTQMLLSVKFKSFTRTFDANKVYWDVITDAKDMEVVYHLPASAIQAKEDKLRARVQHAILQAAKQYPENYACHALPKLYGEFDLEAFKHETMAVIEPVKPRLVMLVRADNNDEDGLVLCAYYLTPSSKLVEVSKTHGSCSSTLATMRQCSRPLTEDEIKIKNTVPLFTSWLYREFPNNNLELAFDEQEFLNCEGLEDAHTSN